MVLASLQRIRISRGRGYGGTFFFGGTKVRRYGGTRIDLSRNYQRADYPRTSVPPYLRTPEKPIYPRTFVPPSPRKLRPYFVNFFYLFLVLYTNRVNSRWIRHKCLVDLCQRRQKDMDLQPFIGKKQQLNKKYS